jgi:hypothetical protein
MVPGLARAMEMTLNSCIIEHCKKSEHNCKAKVVTTLKFRPNYVENIHTIFIELCMKGDPSVRFKGK